MFAGHRPITQTMVALDPVTQVAESAARFDAVQQAAVQQQLSQDVKLIRATHESTPVAEDGKGQHVNVVV